MNLDVGFGGRLDAGEVEGCSENAGSADGENSPEGEWRGREYVVVRRGGRAGCRVGADVDQSAFEVTLRAFFLHLVGSWRQNLRDGAGAAPGYNVLCSAAGTFHLGMGGEHVYFDALSKCERCRGTLQVEAIFCCALQVFPMGAGIAVESGNGNADGGGDQCRCKGCGLGLQLLGVVIGIVLNVGWGVRVWRSKCGDGGGTVVHLKG